MRQDRYGRMSMENIFTALIMVQAGHHQDHSIRKIDVVRPNHRMEKLNCGDKDRL
jgi:hypothetical protein